MMRRHQNRLKKISKDFRPWDYSWFMKMIEECLQFFNDYYELGYNVFQDDSSGDIVRSSLSKALPAAKVLNDGSYMLDIDMSSLKQDELAKVIEEENKEEKRLRGELFDTIKDFISYWWD